nr:MAG: hypothetical protein 1 [Leviviridae sp.]
MYTGPLVAEAGSIPVSSLGSRSTESSLNAVGTTAIARSIPTNPPANVSVMLGELFREGVPKAVGASLLKNRFRDYRDIGSEYLNFEFGWKPIVADLKSVAKAVRESERILNQLERDSGRNVRRKFVFPTVNKSSNRVLTNFSTATERALLSGMVWPAQTTVISEHFSQRRWFSGCFTYHFERPSGQRAAMADAAQKARLLYGVDLTPEVVWNLAPWTWLADWVSNAGDIMTNVSRFSRDGLVMRYGYIMENTFRSYSIDCQNVSVSRSWGGPRDLFSCSTSWTEEFKVRQTATPFGFGLTAESFDPRQWAILGALGISRGPNVL